MEDGSVRIEAGVAYGTNVRPAGGDLHSGETVFTAGTRLDAAHVAVLASLGVTPTVRRRPVVAVMSTGDEIVPPETRTLAPGSIRDSNRPLLVGLLDDLGVSIVDYAIVRDDAEVLRRTLGDAAREADVVVTSGGVSMGEYDLVKAVLGELGTVEFWQVAMQPAKPFAFGFVGDTPLFGLPGNPVSVFTAFEQFVRPALLKMMGAVDLFRVRVPGRMGEPVETDPRKEVVLRVRLEASGEGTPTVYRSGGQSSNVLSALATADALAVVPVGTSTLDAGQGVELELFRSPEGRTWEDALRGS
jgi:molybdopterin molybdotransferase